MKNSLPKITLLILALCLPLSAFAQKNILVFGDSLSAAYGIPREAGWVNLLQQELQRTQSQFSTINASISGETTTGGRQRIAKSLQQHSPEIVIVELGANDGLRGAPISSMKGNLSYIIEQAHHTGAKVLLIGMQLPPNYGQAYTQQFADTYQQLAKKYGILLLPFLLEGVTPSQFQADNLHPVAQAQQRIMLNVMQELKHLLH